MDGGYFEGYPEVTIQHTRSVSQAEVIPPHSFKEDMIVIPVSDAEWNAVAYALFNRLFIHEWEDESYCDPTICDGEQWELNLRILTMPPVSALAKIHDRMAPDAAKSENRGMD